jgi:uncharacterized membrane protein HdeD (DUF308 family)
MTEIDEGSPRAQSAPPVWLRVSLGLVLILGGLLVLGDIALATFVSTIFIGYTAIVVGAFEIVHAFWTKGWGGLFWHVLLGALYILFGWAVLSQPASGALILTAVLGAIFLASAVVRIVVAFANWSAVGPSMLISGVLGLMAGGIILSGWPGSSSWVLGLLLGIDLISSGVAWMLFGLLPSARGADSV